MPVNFQVFTWNKKIRTLIQNSQSIREKWSRLLKLTPWTYGYMRNVIVKSQKIKNGKFHTSLFPLYDIRNLHELCLIQIHSWRQRLSPLALTWFAGRTQSRHPPSRCVLPCATLMAFVRYTWSSGYEAFYPLVDSWCVLHTAPTSGDGFDSGAFFLDRVTAEWSVHTSDLDARCHSTEQ